MNKKYNYKWYRNYFENDYSEEIDSIVTDGIYDFEDWIRDSIYRTYNGNYAVERDNDTYYILDGSNDRTGEMYVVVSVENTEEDLRG